MAAPASSAAPPAPLDVPTLLSTRRLRLRAFRADDADALFALQSDPVVLRYWDEPPWRERARVDRFLARCVEMEREGSGTRRAIERRDDGAFLGWCTLGGRHAGHRTASLGYCLQPAAWGHGYAREASAALLRWGFGALALRRVQAETDTRNAASARVLEKLGFVREGTLREDCDVEGDVSSTWVYGLLRREWKDDDARQ